MSTAEILAEMKDRIVRNFRPAKIILFGSHARGDAGKHSDIDLLVVMSDVEDRRETAVSIRRVLADLPASKDIIVSTPEEIAHKGTLVGTILRPALREGKVIYERE